MKMLTIVRKFLRTEIGAASVFMICMLPIVLVMGGLAIDGANAWRMRTILQATADSAALAAGIELPNINNAVQAAQTYAAKNMPVASNGNVLATTDIETGNWNVNSRVFTANSTPVNAVQVTVQRSAANSNALPSPFLNLIGQSDWNVVARSIVTSETSKLWISLVLDNTGSMTETDRTGKSKISALKTAAHQLLAQLQSVATTPGDVNVAIVPFSKDVNVGTSNVDATWIDWTDWSAPPANGTPSSNTGPGSACPYSTSSQGYGCQNSSTNGSSLVSTVPSSGNICPGMDNGVANSGRLGHYYNGCYNSVAQQTCTTHGHRQTCSTTYTHNWVANSHSTWRGCVMDRTQNYDVTNTSPGSSTNYPAENAQSCVPSAITPLNYNWTSLNNQIDAMGADGSTNQTVGLVWGWQAMTQGSPLNPPTPPQNIRQVVILLSDGLNTQDRWYGDGSNESTQVDSRMAAACTNAKYGGIVIYTVFVDLYGTQGNSSVLQNCASDPSKYFDLTTSGQIISTFAKIAQQITHRSIVE